MKTDQTWANVLVEQTVNYYSILLKKVLHHPILTKFLSNVLNKYTKHTLNGELETLSDTTINLCRNILLKSVKMHLSGNTEILGF